jgi:ribosomal protein S28E/S33
MRLGWKPASPHRHEDAVDVLGAVGLDGHTESHRVRVMAGRLELVVIKR